MVYDGWHNGRFELMAWYQKLQGLKPIGPHRPLADRLFKSAFRLCEPCQSRGYFDAVGGRSFVVCEKCGGAGYYSIISTEERAELRAQVFAEFPEAAAPCDLPNPAFSVNLYDHATSEMIVLPQELSS
jgi:hypothetical protein